MNNRILTVLKGTFPYHKGEFLPEMGPDDISEWDSLAHLNLVMAINNEFGISLEFEEVMAIACIQDIYNILSDRGIK